jgi:hypothetical protein
MDRTAYRRLSFVSHEAVIFKLPGLVSVLHSLLIDIDL